MAFSDSNRVSIRWKAESAWGETPASSTLSELRLTGETLGHQKSTVMSDELRSDKMRADIVEVAANAGGDVSIELSLNTFDDFLQGLLTGTYVAVSTVGSVVFSPSTITFATSTVAESYTAGSWIRVKGGPNAGIFRLGTRTGLVWTTNSDTMTSIATSAIVQQNMLRNGTTSRSYFIEKNFTDIGDVIYFTGMRIGAASLNFQANSIATGSFTFTGEGGFYSSTTLANTVTSATTSDVLNATSNIGSIYEGSYTTPLADSLQSLTLNINGNLRYQQAIGTKYPVGIGEGSFEITGTVQAYFESATLYKKMLAHTSTSLSFRLTDAAGNVMVITLPKVYWSEGNPTAGGINQDILLPLSFMAARDSTTNCMMQVDVLPITVGVT